MSGIFCLSHVIGWDCDNEDGLLKWHRALFDLNFPLCLLLMFGFSLVGNFDISSRGLKKLVQTRCKKNVPVTFADVARDAADLPVDHLLVELFDVERLHGEGQRSRQHGKGAHASARDTKGNTVLEDKNIALFFKKTKRYDRIAYTDQTSTLGPYFL